MFYTDSLLLNFAFFALAVWFVFVLPGDMARHRHRNPYSWIFFSVLLTPLVTLPLLLILGTPNFEDA